MRLLSAPVRQSMTAFAPEALRVRWQKQLAYPASTGALLTPLWTGKPPAEAPEGERDGILHWLWSVLLVDRCTARVRERSTAPAGPPQNRAWGVALRSDHGRRADQSRGIRRQRAFTSSVRHASTVVFFRYPCQRLLPNLPMPYPLWSFLLLHRMIPFLYVPCLQNLQKITNYAADQLVTRTVYNDDIRTVIFWENTTRRGID